MFYGCWSFYQDISGWNVSNVTNMSAMFYLATSFNQDISNWSVSNVTTMASMFRQASSFNGDISTWNVSSVTDMTNMFLSANALVDDNKCFIHTAFSSNGNWTYDWSSSCSNSNFVISSGAGEGWRLLSSPQNGSTYLEFLGDLWLQGCTDGDTGEGFPNVYYWNASGQSWTSITNCNTTITRGTLVLVYVFQDVDYDGDNDLPVTITTLTNTSNGITSESSITSGEYIGLGNPFSSQIDWDLVNRVNDGSVVSIQAIIYLYNPSISDWVSYTSNGNGTGTDGASGTGTPTDGIIAPYQGFFVKSNVTNSGGSNATKSKLTIDTGDISTASSTFLGRNNGNNNTGNVKFIATTDNSTSTTFLNFNQWGEIGKDIYDADKLLPLNPTKRVVMMSYNDNDAIDINTLPFSHNNNIDLDMDVMCLDVNENNEFATLEEEVTLTWNLDNLPDDISIILTDLINNTSINLSDEYEYTFHTQEKGSFEPYLSESEFSSYPKIGESRFILSVVYGSSLDNKINLLPDNVILHQIHPNPFNPVTNITYGLHEYGNVELTVYNIQGEQVETLVNNFQVAGYHTLTWNASSYPSGVYLIRMDNGEFTQTQKVVLVK